jgi:hypothetical protein
LSDFNYIANSPLWWSVTDRVPYIMHMPVLENSLATSFKFEN